MDSDDLCRLLANFKLIFKYLFAFENWTLQGYQIKRKRIKKPRGTKYKRCLLQKIKNKRWLKHMIWCLVICVGK